MLLRILPVALLLSVMPLPAWAQTSSAKWSVEWHVGGARSSSPSGAVTPLPAAGANVAIALPGLNAVTRRVPSWYFGDGALLFNQVNVQRNAGANQIVPLDPVLTSASARRRSGISAGARLVRGITPRVSIEIGVDVASNGLEWTDDAKAQIEASRASFLSAWQSLLGLQNSPSVTSLAAIDAGSQRTIAASCVFDVDLLSSPRGAVFVSVGMGGGWNVGRPPSATLTGHYQFTPPGLATLSETDLVTIQPAIGSTVLGIVGAGWRQDLASRWGVRADVRAELAPNAASIGFSAMPAQVLTTDNTKAFGAVLGGNPAIVISNAVQSNTFTSSLGTTVTARPGFTGRGVQWQVHATAGLYLRF